MHLTLYLPPSTGAAEATLTTVCPEKSPLKPSQVGARLALTRTLRALDAFLSWVKIDLLRWYWV
ncbi:MAG: hypothetical protein N2512_00590 [Armatimonadetes bacterium]|nr:hypothetical protein [Armatimonadota bacterium]